MGRATLERDRMALALLLRPDISARYERRLMPPDSNGCILWSGALVAEGYGQFTLPAGTRPQFRIPAHRAALLRSTGLPPADAMDAAHSCRNKHCVAPAHLRWATPAENAADRKRDGTQTVVIGRMSGRAVLNPELARQLRQEYAAGVTQAELGRRHGLGKTVVRDVVNGRRWIWVDDPVALAAEAEAHARRVREFGEGS